MIKPEDRFYVSSGMLMNGGPYQCGSPKLLPNEDAARDVLSKFIDSLPLDAHSITVSDDLKLIDGFDVEGFVRDPTPFIQYPSIQVKEETRGSDWLPLSNMVEMDRISVCVDLVQPTCGRDTGKLRIFKYTLVEQRPQNIWDEAHILKGLRAQSSIITLEQLVVDDVEPRLVGFTTPFIAGGNLEMYQGIFMFRWMHDLTATIDDLNLRFAIIHQDIAPRNILIEPHNGHLKIFDFDRAAKLGSKEQGRGASDVNELIFAVYEALTRDEQFPRVPPPEQKVELVEEMGHWDLKLEIEDVEGGIAAYRKLLATWAEGRRSYRKVERHADAIEPLEWPEFPIEAQGPYHREQAYKENRHVMF